MLSLQGFGWFPVVCLFFFFNFFFLGGGGLYLQTSIKAMFMCLKKNILSDFRKFLVVDDIYL